MQNITQSEDGFFSKKSELLRNVSAYLDGYRDGDCSIKLQNSSRQNFIQLKINDGIKTLLFKSVYVSRDSFVDYTINFESDNFDIFKEDQTKLRHKLEDEEEIAKVLNEVMQIFEAHRQKHPLSTSLPKTCDLELKIQEDYFGELYKVLSSGKDFSEKQSYFYDLILENREKILAVCHSAGLFINSRNISANDSNIYLINYHVKHQDVIITRCPVEEVDDLEEKKRILKQIIANITKDKTAKFYPNIKTLTAVRVDQVAQEPRMSMSQETQQGTRIDQVALEPEVAQVAKEPGMSMLHKTQQGRQAVGGDNFVTDTEHPGVAYHISSGGIPSGQGQDRATQVLELERRLYTADNTRPQQSSESFTSQPPRAHSCIAPLIRRLKQCLRVDR